MNIALWILQGLLAAVFLMAGSMKLTQPLENLKSNMGWVENVSSTNVKLIGFLELLGAVGLILPQLTGILPWLTPLAAIGLALTMIGAMIVHVRRNEMNALPTNIVLLSLAAFVAYGRFVLTPVA